MRRRRSARTGLAGAAALVIHLVLLLLLAMRTGPMTIRSYDEDALQVALVAPIYLPRRAKLLPTSAPRPRTARTPSAAVAPLRMAPTESAGAAAPPAAAGPSPIQALNGDIGTALGRRLGCARADLAGLNREERLACQDALGRGARQAAALGQPVSAEKQAYYDAVKAARQSEGHGPHIGCTIQFGGGKPASVKTPAHSLKLGPLPCFIQPPAGMLSPEADVPDPY